MMNKRLKLLMFFAPSIMFFLWNISASANIFSGNLNEGPGGRVTVQFLFNILQGIACWSVRFGMILVGIMIVIAGIMYFLSRGNTQKMTDAKKTLTWGVVGAMVIFGVFTIIYSVAVIIGVEYSFFQTLSCG